MDGQGTNPGVSVILSTRPDWLLGPLSLLYNGNQVLPEGVNRPVRGVDHATHLEPKLKKQ